MPTLYIGIDARGAKTGADEVDRATDKAGKGARRMAEAFDFAKAAIVKSLGLIKSAVSGLYNSIDYLAKRGALLGTAFIALNVHTAESIDRLNDMAKALDVSVEKMSLLQYASGRAGTGIEEIVQALKAVSGRAQSALAGDKDAKSLFSLLGVDPAGKSSLSLIEGVATGLDKMTDRTQKLAIAQDLLGRSGFKVVELFKDNAQQFRELSGDAIKYGAVVDENLAGTAENLADAWGNFKNGLVSVQNEILRGSGKDLTDFLNSIGESLASNRFTIGAYAGALVDSFEQIGKILAEGGLNKSASQFATLFGDSIKSIVVNIAPAAGRSALELGKIIGFAIVDGVSGALGDKMAVVVETLGSAISKLLPDAYGGNQFKYGSIAGGALLRTLSKNPNELNKQLEVSIPRIVAAWGQAGEGIQKDLSAAYNRFLDHADDSTRQRVKFIQKLFADIPIAARLAEIGALNSAEGRSASSVIAGIIGGGFTDPKDAIRFLDDILERLRAVQKEKARAGTFGDSPGSATAAAAAAEAEDYSYEQPILRDFSEDRNPAKIEELISAKRRELDLLKMTGIARERSIALYEFEAEAIGFAAEEIDEYRQRYTDLVDSIIAESRRRELAESISGPIGQGVEDAIVRLEGFRDIAVSIFDEIKRAAVRAFVTRPLTEGLTSGLQSAFGSLGLFGGGAGNSSRQAISDANRQLGG